MFLAMEYVPGQTLRDVIASEGPLTPAGRARRARAGAPGARAQRTRAGPHPPRRQARERHPPRRRRGQGRRLRARPRGDQPDRRRATSGRAARHGRLPLPRAGRARDRRRPQRRLRRGADALRDAHRHQGVQRRHRRSTSPTSTCTAACPTPSSRVAGLPPSSSTSSSPSRDRPRPRRARPPTLPRFSTLVRRTRAASSPRRRSTPDPPASRRRRPPPSRPSPHAALPVSAPRPASRTAAPAASATSPALRAGPRRIARDRRRRSRARAVRPPAAASPRRRGRGRLVVVSALIAAADRVVLHRSAPAPRPSCRRSWAEPVAEAVSAVRRRLDPHGRREGFSETVPAGVVISSRPRRRHEVRRGTDVTLVVSKGPERYAVPPWSARALAEATAQIRRPTSPWARSTEAFNEKVPEGQVVAANPKAGAGLKRGTVVALTVSKGRQPITVPDFTGKPPTPPRPRWARRASTVEAAGEENSDTVPGRVDHARTPPTARSSRATRSRSSCPRARCWSTVPERRRASSRRGPRRSSTAAGFKVEVRQAIGGILRHGAAAGARPAAAGAQGRDDHPDDRSELTAPPPAGRDGPASPTLLLVAVTAVWGSTFFLIRDLVEHVPPADFLAVRFGIAAVVMFVLFRRQTLALTPA